MSQTKKRRTNQLVDMKEMKRELISQLIRINGFNKPNKYKENRQAALAKSTLERLRNPKNESGEVVKLSPQTLYRYVTLLRTAVREHGFKGYEFESEINELIKLHPRRSNKLEAIRDANHRDASKLLKSYVAEIEKSEKSMKSESQIESARELRRTLENKINKLLDPAILHHLVRESDDYKELQPFKQARKEVQESAEKRYTYDYQEVMSLIPKLLTAPKCKNAWIDLAIGIALATGRRMYEVMYLSTITRGRNRTVYVRGFAKKKDSQDQLESSNKNHIQEFPCLANPKLVVSAFERLRNTERSRLLSQKLNEIDSYSEKSAVLNGSVKKQLGERVSELLGESIVLKSDGEPALFKTEDGRSSGLSYKICRDLYVNCVWDEHLVSNPEVSTNFAYKTAWVRDHLNHENDMSATSYDKFSNRLDVNERVMSVARKHNEKFIENDKSRIKAITEMLNSDSVQSRKVLIKAFTFIIQKLEENSEYEITNYSLRMAIPKPEGGFKPVCKPAIIKEIVEMLSEKKLDKPH